VFSVGFSRVAEEEIDKAANGLRAELDCASVISSIVPIVSGSQTAVKTSTDNNFVDMTAETDTGDLNKKANPRPSFITIREKERSLLEDPTEWLNDTLIDFWMEWYVTYCMLQCSKDVHVLFVFVAVHHH
jgi:hypothetical protein